MENTMQYSHEFQPYKGDYDKFEYDVKLKDGTILLNCYPNARKFNSFNNRNAYVEESEVVEIRFSRFPMLGINPELRNLRELAEEYANHIGHTKVAIIGDIPLHKSWLDIMHSIEVSDKWHILDICKYDLIINGIAYIKRSAIEMQKKKDVKQMLLMINETTINMDLPDGYYTNAINHAYENMQSRLSELTIETEFRLIMDKKSVLSRSMREAVVDKFNEIYEIAN